MLIGQSGLAHRPRKLPQARGCGQVDSSSCRSNRPAGRGQRFALPTARASAHLPTASHHDYQDKTTSGSNSTAFFWKIQGLTELASDYWRLMPRWLLRRAIKRCSRLCKAVDLPRQGHSGLRGAHPDMAGKLDHVRIVVAAPRDRSELRPPFEGQAHRRATRRTEMNEDLLVAAVRSVFVLPQLAFVEPNAVHREERFRVERRASHTLAERAVAGKRPNRRLVGLESNLAAEATALE